MLTNGEKSIIFLLNSNDKRMSKLRLVKLMFLISKRMHVYDFIPYNYGPFSFTLYRDLSKLEKNGIISTNGETLSLIKQELPELDRRLRNIIRMYSQEFSKYDDNALIDYVYDKYPKYTIFSLYRKNEEYKRDSIGITTIGYEGKSLDKFLEEIISNKINTVIDVRRNPYSKKYGFHGGTLKGYLQKINVEYIHIPELGIPSEERQNLENNEDYKNLFENYRISLIDKRSLLNEIAEMSKHEKISLMCFEKNIKHCHRGVLAELFKDEGLEVTNL